MDNDSNCAYNYWYLDEEAFANMGGYDSIGEDDE
jgi:hypothetical protein